MTSRFLTAFIAARVAAHWAATRKRGHDKGFLRHFLVVPLGLTAAHGVFLALVLGNILPDSVNRADVAAGVQWMLAAQAASLVLNFWFLGNWPFAEIRARTDWMLGRVLMVHRLDISSLVPRWQPKKAPGWLASSMDKIRPAHDKEAFADYWRRESRLEAEKHARDEEVLDA